MLPIWQDSPASRRLHHLREVGLRYRLFEAGVGLAARAIGTDTRVRSNDRLSVHQSDMLLAGCRKHGWR